MAGDVVWRPDQRVVPARFLGHTVQLPEAPFMLALVSGAPLYVFFASIRGPGGTIFPFPARWSSWPMAVPSDDRPWSGRPRDMPSAWKNRSGAILWSGTILSRF